MFLSDLEGLKHSGGEELNFPAAAVLPTFWMYWLLKFNQQLTFINGLTLFNGNGFDHAFANSLDDIFHFHGFQNEQGIIFLYGLPGLDQHTQHQSRHGGFYAVYFLCTANG